MLENFLLIITKYFKAKQISLEQLKEIPLGYPDSFSIIEEYSENFIHAQDNYRIFIMDASSENAYLEDEEKKYNLLIISVNDNKIKKYYQMFYGNDKILQYVIEQFCCSDIYVSSMDTIIKKSS